jgi:hypothetical protein
MFDWKVMFTTQGVVYLEQRTKALVYGKPNKEKSASIWFEGISLEPYPSPHAAMKAAERKLLVAWGQGAKIEGLRGPAPNRPQPLRSQLG